MGGGRFAFFSSEYDSHTSMDQVIHVAGVTSCSIIFFATATIFS